MGKKKFLPYPSWWDLLADIARLQYAQHPWPCLCDNLALMAFGNSGGQARAITQKHLDSGVRKLWEAAGGGERGAQVTAWLAARDGQARYCPDWLLTEWRAHADAVRDVLAIEAR